MHDPEPGRLVKITPEHFMWTTSLRISFLWTTGSKNSSQHSETIKKFSTGNRSEPDIPD